MVFGNTVEPRVVSRRNGRFNPGAIYVGRPSKWGNPFVIGQHGDREEVLRRYRKYLLSRQDLLDALPELRGHDLECWCAPEPCHADILLEMANAEIDPR